MTDTALSTGLGSSKSLPASWEDEATAAQKGFFQRSLHKKRTWSTLRTLRKCVSPGTQMAAAAAPLRATSDGEWAGCMLALHSFARRAYSWMAVQVIAVGKMKLRIGEAWLGSPVLCNQDDAVLCFDRQSVRVHMPGSSSQLLCELSRLSLALQGLFGRQPGYRRGGPTSYEHLCISVCPRALDPGRCKRDALRTRSWNTTGCERTKGHVRGEGSDGHTSSSHLPSQYGLSSF